MIEQHINNMDIDDEQMMIHLALNHSFAELFCFTTELSSDPGEPKTLHEALEGPDAQQWKDVIANEIMNFI